jgi:hypothetical protein
LQSEVAIVGFMTTAERSGIRRRQIFLSFLILALLVWLGSYGVGLLRRAPAGSQAERERAKAVRERVRSRAEQLAAESDIYRALQSNAAVVRDPLLDRETGPLLEASPARPTIVLAILDTVRADHTSLCGYARDTTPFLRELVAKGATFSCRAYSPSDWSLPSHASYFTGLSPLEHGAHYAHPEKVELAKRVGDGTLLVNPLAAEHKTLAETLAADGYQTVLVSDNRLLGQAGLGRSFETVRLRPRNHDPRIDWVPSILRQVLAEDVDPKRPLFLVLNFLQAHDPWVKLPDTIAWPDRLEPPLPHMLFFQWFQMYLVGSIGDVELRKLRHQLRDLYDYGVLREDRALSTSLGFLRDAGWLSQGYRVAMTADHGELLIEKGTWRHVSIYEANTRVPFVYWSSDEPPQLPSPFPAVAVHHLLVNGTLPDPLPRVTSVSIPQADKPFAIEMLNEPAIALWFGTEKLAWSSNGIHRYDLTADPTEETPLAVADDDPRVIELRKLVAKLAEAKNAAPSKEQQEELLEELRALGYVE